MNFLAAFLREEGGLEFKKSIVDSIVELMTTIPDTKETSLLHLCEFIEDCEFSELIVQILHLIGMLCTDRHAYDTMSWPVTVEMNVGTAMVFPSIASPRLVLYLRFS